MLINFNDMLRHIKCVNYLRTGKHKKRAASTAGSERDLATATSSTSVASPGKVVGANGSSVSMYPGDAASRRVINPV